MEQIVYRIVSEEYKHNAPSVFMIGEASGRYYGDMVYPSRDCYPDDPEHWRNAESSDGGRGFKVDCLSIPEYLSEWFDEVQDKIELYKSWISKGVLKEDELKAYGEKVLALIFAQTKLIEKL